MLYLYGHNPYFSRWFSAIDWERMPKGIKYCHNPYFSRWFSAITNKERLNMIVVNSHNPYFSRWFSAI